MRKFLSLIGLFTMIGLLYAGNQGSDLQVKTDEWFQNHPDSYPHWLTPEEEQRKDEKKEAQRQEAQKQEAQKQEEIKEDDKKE